MRWGRTRFRPLGLRVQRGVGAGDEPRPPTAASLLEFAGEGGAASAAGWGGDVAQTYQFLLSPVESDAVRDSIRTMGAALVDPNAYVLPFEIASVLLLGALIGAIVVAQPEKKS